jgi:hypothetical protein
LHVVSEQGSFAVAPKNSSEASLVELPNLSARLNGC